GVVDFDREHVVAGDTLTSTGASYDGFLAKYDPSGTLLWVKALDGTVRAAANGVAIDALGNANPADDRVYVVGLFDTGLGYPGAIALSGTTSSGFLLRTDANGAPVQFGALPSSGPPNT